MECDAILRRPLNRHRVAASWRTSPPFVINTRGLLIHRPCEVVVYNIHAAPHLAVDYLCGGSVTGGMDENSNLSFVRDLPDGALVCHRCELVAAEKELPSASEICGRHVHIGACKVRQICCVKERKE